MPTKKECTRCGKMLPLTDFSPCAHGRHGRYCRCKKCHALLARIRRAKKSQRQRTRQSHRAWRERNRAVASGAAQRWKRRNPAKLRAHYAVRAAVLGGLLVRPDHCAGCSRAGPVVAHHSDYARPLDVEWLCRRCHARRHVDERLDRTTEAA